MYLITLEESIADILRTPLGSRLMRPNYGSRLHELIDRRVDDNWRALAARYAVQAIRAHEPRAQVSRVQVLQKDARIWLKIHLQNAEPITVAL